MVRKLMMVLALMPMMAWASLTDGLVAYYPFDGNANDASGNGNNGVVHGATLTADRFGNANRAYYFDRNYIEVPNSVSLASVTNNMTLMTWFKANDSNALQRWVPFFCKGEDRRQFSLSFYGGDPNTRIFLNDYIGTGKVDTDMAVHVSNDVFTVGTWYHVAISYDGATLKAYINGEEVGTKVAENGFSAADSPLYIGKDPPGGTEYLNGNVLDEIRIYNRALSAAEVKALHDGTVAISPVLSDGLVAYYPFDGNANDASGNGNNGTTYGVTLTTDRFGNENGAYHFGGSSYISVAGNAQLNAISDYTISAWISAESWYDSRISIVSKGTRSSSSQQYVLQIAPKGCFSKYDGYDYSSCFVINYNVSNIECVLANSEIPFGKWIHVAVTRNGNVAYVYLNGVEIGSGILLDAAPSNSENLDIGRDVPGSTEYFIGDMDDLRIYNHALSAAEVKALYDGAEVTPPATYAVTFDLNGAGGAAPAERQIEEGAAVGDLPIVEREGYTFLGWFTAASGGTQVSASTVVTGNVTYYAQWERIMYTVTFNLNGAGGAAPAERQIAHGDAVGGLPTVMRTGYTFLGWFTAASGGAQISASTAVTGNATYYAQWRVNSYVMTFDANGGVGGTAKTQDYGTALVAPTVTREGYTFVGWSPSVPATVPAADATYTAQWRINSYTVTFDAQGGAGGGTVARNHGAALGELPVPTRDGFSFDGWFTSASGGEEVSSSAVITGAVTFYAHWTEVALYPTPVWYDENGEEVDWTKYYDGDEEAFAAEAAATFDGYVLDGEEVCGLVQVKAGKADRNGTSKVIASLTLVGEAKKLSYKGTMSRRGVARLTCSGRRDLSLCLGTNAMWGELGGLTVSGARNVFAKSGDPKAGALSKWLGAYTLVLETVDAAGSGSGFAWGYSGLTVTVGAKGKVKVQGTMVDGAKVNVTSQLLVGDRRCCIPVVAPLYAKKGGFGFNLWLHDDGSVEVGEMSAWDATASKTPFTAWWGENVPVAKTGAALPASLSFMLAGEPDVAGMEVLYDFLPWEVVFSTGARWTLPAAGSVKYDREAEDYVDAKDSSNPSGLKLTYVVKMGTFKGSFKMYAVDAAGRLKKYTANVSGVMVGRQGYGTASVKGVGSWPVLIE